jgi:hypothetical protein
MTSRAPEEDFFERLSDRAEAAETAKISAPTRLKAKIYSALCRRQVASGPLASVSETKASGRGLCIFEELLRISPLGENIKSLNLCRICHARVLAERLEKAPLYWRNCPYAGFQKG